MAVEYHAAAPFHFFGTDYVTDELIDTTGFDEHAMRALLAEPVYAISGTSVSSGIVHDTTGAPADTLGADNDWAYDPAANIIYGPKAAGAWPAGVALADAATVAAKADAAATASALAAKAARPASGLDGKLAKWDETSGTFLDGGTATVIAGKADKPGSGVDQKPVKWNNSTGQFESAAGVLHTLYAGSGAPPASSPQCRGSASNVTAGATSLTVAVPANVQAGDILIAFGQSNWTGGGAITGGGSGAWIQLDYQSLAAGHNGTMGVYWKVAQADAAGANISVTAGASVDIVIGVAAYYDTDGNAPTYSAQAGETTPVVPSQPANSRVISMFSETSYSNGSPLLTAAGGMTSRITQSTNSDQLLVVDEVLATAGSTTARTATGYNHTFNHRAATITLKPAPAAIALDGDYFLDKAARKFYGPMTGGSWGTPVSLRNTNNPVAKTAAYTAVDGDVVLANATTAAFTVTLPAVAAGAQVVVKKTDASANAVTVTPASGTIDGAASVSIANQYGAVLLVSDGTNWFTKSGQKADKPGSAVDQKPVKWNNATGQFEDATSVVTPHGVVRNGSGVPATALGVGGDVYIDPIARRLYGPRGTNSWGTEIAPVFRDGSANHGTGTVGNVTFAALAGLAVGDTMIFAIHHGNPDATFATEPAGWTKIFESSGTGATDNLRVYKKIAVAGDVGATHSFNMRAWDACALVAYSAADVDVVGVEGSNNTVSIDPTFGTTKVVSIWAAVATSGTSMAVPAGVTQRASVTANAAAVSTFIGDETSDGSPSTSRAGNGKCVALSLTPVVTGVQSYAFDLAPVAKTSAYTATDRDTVLADATTAAFTVTLPAVAAGAKVVVKKIDSSANAVTVAPASGTIDGAANTALSAQWAKVTLISDGTNWFTV